MAKEDDHLRYVKQKLRCVGRINLRHRKTTRRWMTKLLPRRMTMQNPVRCVGSVELSSIVVLTASEWAVEVWRGAAYDCGGNVDA